MTTTPDHPRTEQSSQSGAAVAVWVALALSGTLLLAGVGVWMMWSSQLSPTNPSLRATSGDSVADRAGGGAKSLAVGEDGRPLGPSSSLKCGNICHEFDPALDGWDSEAFGEAAGAQFKIIGKSVESPDKLDVEHLAELVAEGFTCGPLRPDLLSEAFRDGAFRVLRCDVPFADMAEDRAAGAAGLVGRLKAMLGPLAGATDVRTKFKVFLVEVEQQRASCTAYFAITGKTSEQTVQLNATWRAEWVRPQDAPPRMTRLELIDYEEVLAESKGQPLFQDWTEAVLGKNRCFGEQLRYGELYWKKRFVGMQGTYNVDSYGGAVGDVNGDGLEDLYVGQRRGLPNRLFVQNADGTATDVAAEAGVDFLDHTSAAMLLDLDNDGDQDLVVGFTDRVLVLENVLSEKGGKPHFKLRCEMQMEDADMHSMCAADFDNDGDLDIFCCQNFRSPDRKGNLPAFSYTDANEGGANALFRNEGTNKGTWKFLDVTDLVGLGNGKHRRSLAAAWEDFDNDGDQDLYVANDFGPNCLYRNDGGTFTEIAGPAGVVDYGSGMSAAWADVNRDGLMDVYIANMFSSAGSRITAQDKFHPELDATTRALYARFAKGNSLFLNQGGEKFQEVGAEARVEMGRWAWASPFFDLNNDGWEDIYVANGYITNDDSSDL